MNWCLHQLDDVTLSQNGFQSLNCSLRTWPKWWRHLSTSFHKRYHLPNFQLHTICGRWKLMFQDGVHKHTPQCFLYSTSSQAHLFAVRWRWKEILEHFKHMINIFPEREIFRINYGIHGRRQYWKHQLFYSYKFQRLVCTFNMFSNFSKIALGKRLLFILIWRECRIARYINLIKANLFYCHFPWGEKENILTQN